MMSENKKAPKGQAAPIPEGQAATPQPTAAPTPEQQAEVQKRSELFLKEYGELVVKHKIDIAAYPVYQPDGQGGFKTVIQQSCVDTTNQPYRSPFMAKE